MPTIERLNLLTRIRQQLVETHQLLLDRGTVALPRAKKTTKYQFVHTVLHKVLYNGLSDEQRAILHQSIGECLEAEFEGKEEEIAEKLAEHFFACGEIKKAVRYTSLAATKSRKARAPLETERHYAKVLEYIQRLLDFEGKDILIVDLCIKAAKDINDSHSWHMSKLAIPYCEFGISLLSGKEQVDFQAWRDWFLRLIAMTPQSDLEMLFEKGLAEGQDAKTILTDSGVSGDSFFELSRITRNGIEEKTILTDSEMSSIAPTLLEALIREAKKRAMELVQVSVGSREESLKNLERRIDLLIQLGRSLADDEMFESCLKLAERIGHIMKGRILFYWIDTLGGAAHASGHDLPYSARIPELVAWCEDHIDIAVAKLGIESFNTNPRDSRWEQIKWKDIEELTTRIISLPQHSTIKSAIAEIEADYKAWKALVWDFLDGGLYEEYRFYKTQEALKDLTSDPTEGFYRLEYFLYSKGPGEIVPGFHRLISKIESVAKEIERTFEAQTPDEARTLTRLTQLSLY